MKDFLKDSIVKIITYQAKFILKKNNPKIIAVTGNLGKTSTKDFIYTALKKNLQNEKGDSLLLASKKSMNSDTGIPLTILGLETGWTSFSLWFKIIINGFVRMFDTYEYKYLVLEVGADAPGDIEKICRYVKPDIAVLTGFAEVPVHIEFFDNDREKLIREKKYLIENIKEGGTFIYNLDDEDCRRIASEMSSRNINLKSFSIKDPEADIYANNIDVDLKEDNKYITRVTGCSADLHLKNKKESKVVMQGVVGEAVFYSLLPSMLIADQLNVDIQKAIEDIEKTKRTSGRMRVLEGVHNSTIIDDTYNSSPKALRHGIDVVKNIKTKGKKIFVLGDMLELGDYTKREHENIGKLLVGVADILIVSGIRAKMIADSAIASGMDRDSVIITTGSVEAGRELLIALENEVEKDYKEGRVEKEVGGDLIFVKGSQGARMEKVVRMILGKNHNPDTDLVRQDKMWKLK